MKQPAALLFENGTNWQYATATHVSDPALWYRSPSGATHVVINALEHGHIAATNAKTKRISHVHTHAEAVKALAPARPTLAAMVHWLAGLEKPVPDTIMVPADFPALLLEKLRAEGLPLQVQETEPFFAERALKTPDEINKLKAAQATNQLAFKHAFAILKAAKIRRDNTLLWHNKPLTAEILQGEMNALLVKHGCTEFGGGPIVACGAQGAVPHERGHGPLKAHQFIVIDCFPRHQNGYWGDLTRTVLKGTPSPWHRKIYNAVLAAQKLALSQIKPGANGHAIHNAVVAYLEDQGFPTGPDFGMFHGTGHGVGLELHDPGPRTLSGSPSILQPGMVTSVEPGLYYPRKGLSTMAGGGIGGCRIEDVVAVTESGMQNLTTLPKTGWIIP